MSWIVHRVVGTRGDKREFLRLGAVVSSVAAGPGPGASSGDPGVEGQPQQVGGDGRSVADSQLAQAALERRRTGEQPHEAAGDEQRGAHQRHRDQERHAAAEAEALLARVEQAVDHINDESDADIDAQRVGGMITLVFANRSQIVINLQKPLHEVWLAAKSGGYHYKFDGQAWRDTKTGNDFYADLTRDATVQSGMKLAFSA